MPGPFRHFLKCDRGSAAVEFGIVGVLFLMSLFGLLEVSRIFWTWNSMQAAVESAARYYMTHEDTSDSALAEYVRNRMPGLQADSAHLAITISHTKVSNINFIEVDGAYAFTVLSGRLLPPALNNMRLSSAARLAVP